MEGPVELLGAVHGQPTLAGLVVDEIVVEAQSAVDEFSGPRNHDLVVRGHLPNGERVVACVEAKAGEDLGPTVAQQSKAAAAAKAKADKMISAMVLGADCTDDCEARLLDPRRSARTR